jgi:hypothetical protein
MKEQKAEQKGRKEPGKLGVASGGFGSFFFCGLFDEFSVFNLGSSYFWGIFGGHRQVV